MMIGSVLMVYFSRSVVFTHTQHQRPGELKYTIGTETIILHKIEECIYMCIYIYIHILTIFAKKKKNIASKCAVT
jgi:hypothetical protein